MMSVNVYWNVSFVEELTSALAIGPGHSLSSLFSIASLSRAVADTICPVGLAAEAADITSSAAELSVGDTGHVVGAQLLSRVSTEASTNIR